MIDERKNVQTTPTRTYCKRSRPLPYSNPIKEDAPALEVYPAPSHHPTTPRYSVKIDSSSTRNPHAHFQYVHNGYERFQKDPLITVGGVDYTNSIP